MPKEPVSGRLLTESILKVIESLSKANVIQIRDLCNDIIVKHSMPTIHEPEEFKTWRVKPGNSTFDLPTHGEPFGRQWRDKEAVTR